MTFFVSVFFIKPLLLILIDTMRISFDVYTIFVELLIFESDSLVYSPPGSRSEGLVGSELFNHGPLATGKKYSHG
jgi:hypothetical protein